MAEEQERSAVTDCPVWCGAKHRTGSPYHVHGVGEVRLKVGNVAVAVMERFEEAGIEVTYSVRGRAPAIAFLGAPDARRLRDTLDEALRSLGAA
ncbi:hypothetical protein [Dactylosporangium sp. NPDC049140]|uniref:hypothetical protein n=1 Tax=Dactylosporangium sp. NPDC049140 TaxID=3155647 RepID=UPI0033CB9D62